MASTQTSRLNACNGHRSHEVAVLWEQGESGDVVRADHGEVAAIDGGDLVEAEPFMVPEPD